MESGLVSSLSGAMAQSKRIETISNNLANADTVGFKERDLVFEEVLSAAHQDDNRTDISQELTNESQPLNKAGSERRTVLYGADYTNLKAGPIRQTNNPLDVAIDGNGFLEVLSPEGIRLTRAGNMALNSNGELVTPDGFLILGAGAGNADVNPSARALRVGSRKITIDEQGNIYANNERGGQNLGRLSLVQVDNPSELKHAGRNLFEATPDAFVRSVGQAPNRGPAAVDPNVPQVLMEEPKENPLGPSNVAPRVLQGMLEGSNVNPVQQMGRLIEAHRLFEQNVKLMQTTGDMTSRASEIGKF